MGAARRGGPRVQAAAERRADAAVHALGLAFAAVAPPLAVGLAVGAGGAARVAGVAIYAATLVATLGLSAAYNLRVDSPRREWLRRLDHAAIYLKIAGSYTPFAVAPLADGPGRALLVGVWGAAAAGCALKLLAPRRFELASVGLYLALGWSGLLVAGDAARMLSGTALALIGAGGALYSAGVVFHLWDGLRYQNAIWHGFGLAATVCIYAAVLVETA